MNNLWTAWTTGGYPHLGELPTLPTGTAAATT